MDTLIWTEKYRPREFSDIKGQDDIVRTIQAMVEKQNLPHLLFSGPAGVGKTTLSLVIAKKLFGDAWKNNFLELNASVTPDTPILIKEKGIVKRTDFKYLADKYFSDNNSKYSYPKCLEILSIDKAHKAKFMPVKNISRHKVNKIAKISYEGGYIRTSLNHSVIIMDMEGNLSSKEAGCLKAGDHLITFKDAMDSGMMRVPLGGFAPQTHNLLRSGLIENPRVKTILDYMDVDNNNSWLMGLYLAEGCTAFRGKTSGQTIFTVRYPHEEQIAQKVACFAMEKWGIPSYIIKGKSGFNRNIESSIQVKLLNTQLARFFKSNFYDASGIKRAPFKRVPCFMFDAPLESKWAFLQGYMGDACGDWESYLRYSSASQENLIDIAWLGRLSGLDTSVFNKEARIIWKQPSFSYLKTELLPSEILIELTNRLAERKGFNAKYLLRHHLYGKKSKRISKDAFKKILMLIESKSSLNEEEKDKLKKFGKLIESPLSIIQIKKITIEGDYDDFVYDVSVPGAEMFWGGTTPVLLHNSDDRGIDVVRNTIKDFAKTRAIGEHPFKIIYLDECDSLTKEAQQALRRTMEMFVSGTRFILSCVTPETNILLPNEIEISISEFIKNYEKAKEINIYNLSNKKDAAKKDLVLATVQLPPSSIGKKVLEINTMTGRKICVTDDHMLLTDNGWKKAGDLREADFILVYPCLEGTGYEDNIANIIDLAQFVEFISELENKAGKRSIEDANCFRELRNEEKKKVLGKIHFLKGIIESNKGLTEREYIIYNIVKDNPHISRKGIQEAVGLTRIRTAQLLRHIENKGHIKRIIDKKMHYFNIIEAVPYKIRNYMDIRKIVQDEFNISMSYTAVKKAKNECLMRGKVDRILGELKRKGILDITYADFDKMGALSRLCGFMLGDGHLVQNGIRLYFSGNKQALERVKRDLEALGYNNHSKIHSIPHKNIIGGRAVDGISTDFYIDSMALSSLLQFLGVPKGDKTITAFHVPLFVRCGIKFVKREFLRALFGCDGDKPKWRRMNSEAIYLRQNKAAHLKQAMEGYYKEISELLSIFEIKSSMVITDRKEVRTKDSVPVLTFGLMIQPNNTNIFKFYSRIGYAYEEYKDRLSRCSAEYLRHKLYLISQQKQKSELILSEINCSRADVNGLIKKYAVSRDFIAGQIKGKEVHLPRKEFLEFKDWLKKYQFNDVLLKNEIKSIKETKSDIVMDITCHNDHNFITNGFVSHNCNYSSKIIDAIQSRCAVFRFKPLEKAHITEVIESIAKEEKLQLNDGAKKALVEMADGDVRKLVNIMQSCAALGTCISESGVYNIASLAEPKEILEVLKRAYAGDFANARSGLLDVQLKYGLSGIDLIKQIQKEVWNLDAKDPEKLRMIEKCAEIEFRMVEGSDEFVQLEALLASFISR
ncbi:MAG: LAGLIDADG family homing endonuclease [Nanoarchaeota archaeon]|nr:LAGLIDADG family homing endonuclease [Nanoarchaeota archaeon]